jgi:hypothetical protein
MSFLLNPVCVVEVGVPVANGQKTTILSWRISILTKEVQLRFCKGYIQIVTGLTVEFDMIVVDRIEYDLPRDIPDYEDLKAYSLQLPAKR